MKHTALFVLNISVSAGQLREAGRPDVAIAAPERQSEVEDFITGSIFRAADLRAGEAPSWCRFHDAFHFCSVSLSNLDKELMSSFLGAAYKKRQEHLDQVRMQEAAAAAARLQLERVEAAALQGKALPTH